jgi:hypothetical protein
MEGADESKISNVGRTFDALWETGVAIVVWDFARAEFPRFVGDDCRMAGGAYNFTPVCVSKLSNE